MTHELVKLHQGVISLESTPDVGTVFHVYLPLPALEQTAPQPAAAPSTPFFWDQPDALPAHVDELTRQAVRFIWEHYGHAFSREEMAAALGITPGHLTHHFRAVLGVTPWEYLTHVRIERAKELLRSSADSITEIAGRVGYSDAAYFSRVFSQRTGRTPRAYRQQTGG